MKVFCSMLQARCGALELCTVSAAFCKITLSLSILGIAAQVALLSLSRTDFLMAVEQSEG